MGACFNGRRTDSVQKKILAVFTTGLIPVKEHNHPLLLRERRHRLTEESLTDMAVQEEKVLQDWKAKDRVKKSSEESARNLHVIYGTLQYAWITSLNLDASMVPVVISDTLRLVGSQPSEQSKKVAQKDRWRYWKRLFNWFVCPMIAFRESLFCWKMEDWDRITPSSSRWPRCVAWKFGERRVNRRESFNSANLKSEI